MNLDTPAPSSSLFRSLSAVFWLTIRQLSRGRRLFILALVFSLPMFVAFMARTGNHPPSPVDLERDLLFAFLAVALLPVTCLLYASGMIQDEIEEQTLTYLLIRPIPRSLLYLTRLLATYLVTLVLAIVFTLATTLVVWWGELGLNRVLTHRLPVLIGILTLTTFVYTAIFGCLSLYFRRLLAIGLAYILLFEGILSTVDFVIRKATVTYYFRTLVLRWIDGSHADMWGIVLTTVTGVPNDEVPTARECIWALLLAGAVLTAIGMVTFRAMEYKVKAPGES